MQPMLGQMDAAAQAAARKDPSAELSSLKRRLASLGKDAADEGKLKEACQDFEALFIGKLWQQMRDTVPKEGILHSKQEDFYLSLFDTEMSRKMAKAGGIGIGRMLYEQLKATLDATEDGSKDGQSATPDVASPDVVENTLRDRANAVPVQAGPVGGGIDARIDALAREIVSDAGVKSGEPVRSETGRQLAQYGQAAEPAGSGKDTSAAVNEPKSNSRDRHV
jgi:Rod binding domain-containing protein